MTTIKTFSLCIALLSPFNLFTMEHECLAEIGNISIKSEKSGDVIQESILDKIWNKIDRDYVKVGDYVMNSRWHLRPLVGSLLSLCRAYCITPEKAKSELYKIEADISSETNDKKFGKSILIELIERHWYVQYLMQVLEDENVCTLEGVTEGVTGFNIDTLLYSTHEEIAQEIAFSRAYKKFFDDKLGKKKLTDIMPLVMSDIHFTIAHNPRNKNIKPNSLEITDDGNYVRAVDEDDHFITLKTKEGNIPNAYPLGTQGWIHGKLYADNSRAKNAVFGVYSYDFIERYKVVDQNDNYCAMVSDAYTVIDSEFFAKEDQNNPKAIILFARPQEASYLCQKAFNNSYGNSKELKALLASKACNSIEGFPKENLKRVIENRIELLDKK